MILFAHETVFWVQLKRSYDKAAAFDLVVEQYTDSALRWFRQSKAMPEEEYLQWTRKRDAVLKDL